LGGMNLGNVGLAQTPEHLHRYVDLVTLCPAAMCRRFKMSISNQILAQAKKMGYPGKSLMKMSFVRVGGKLEYEYDVFTTCFSLYLH